MFNVTWIPVNTNNIPAGDINPCGEDIVGSPSFPGLFFSTDSNFVYFRIRLNCDPRKPNSADLENAVWGVVIKDAAGNVLFTARVNAKNDPTSNAVQVYTADNTNPFITQVCSNPIVLGVGGNVEVDMADSNFDNTPDFFLDFKIPLTCFPTGFFNTARIYCGFTSEDRNNINKETPPPYGDNATLCGQTPVVPPTVSIVKTVTPLTGTTCTDTPQQYTVSITVTNNSGTTLAGLTLTDTVNPNFTVTAGTNPFIVSNITLAAGASQTFTHTLTGFFTVSGLIPFNTATVTQGATVLGTVVGPNILVTPCRGLIFS